MNLNHDFRHGIDFEFLQRQQNVRLVSGTPLASLGQINVSEGGIKFGFLDGNIASFIDALESVGDTNVIAAPHLVCLNRQRAEIQIGDQKGFLSTTQTETATTQQVEFLDVGTLLRIRPFISDDGMIRLEVHPELSTGEIKLIGGFALPEKSVTQVTTNVLVRDGRTVVIGGLIREDLSETRTQVPILGNIPLIGHLFRRKVDTISRNEIIVLITPRFIEDPGEFGEEQQPVISDFQRRQSPMQVHKMTKIAKRHYGRRYYYMARTAWNAGSVETSLRFLDLSLQFYPHHKDAHNLRERILSGDYQNSVDYETLPPQDEPRPQPALEKPSAAQPLKNQLELIDAHYLRERILPGDSQKTLPPQAEPSPQPAFENRSAAPLLKNQLEFINANDLPERILSGDSQQTLPPQAEPSPPRAFENPSAAPLLKNQLEFGSLPLNTRSVDAYRDWVKSEPLFEGPPRPSIQELP
ncbi:MAG: type II and III secretion system protein [Planctomycetes bacterium]|nr:type II and III secretion system protein [Planctomycetota bacterium]